MIIYYILNAKLVINKSMVLICRDCYRPMWRSLQSVWSIPVVDVAQSFSPDVRVAANLNLPRLTPHPYLAGPTSTRGPRHIDLEELQHSRQTPFAATHTSGLKDYATSTTGIDDTDPYRGRQKIRRTISRYCPYHGPVVGWVENPHNDFPVVSGEQHNTCRESQHLVKGPSRDPLGARVLPPPLLICTFSMTTSARGIGHIALQELQHSKLTTSPRINIGGQQQLQKSVGTTSAYRNQFLKI